MLKAQMAAIPKGRRFGRQGKVNGEENPRNKEPKVAQLGDGEFIGTVADEKQRGACTCPCALTPSERKGEWRENRSARWLGRALADGNR